MTILISGQPITLSAVNPNLVTPNVALLTLTDSITLHFKRPTTLSPLAWTSNATIEVSIVVTVDGVEHRCSARFSGGVRTLADGSEATESRLAFRPTWGYFGGQTTKRLGETAKSSYQIRLEVRRISGSITTTLSAESSENSAPFLPRHNSVAFENVTDAQEFTGDGIISLSHTATGTNLAAFAGIAHSRGGVVRTSTSTTYAGTNMTEMWDFGASGAGNAGYQLAAPATSPQTVTNTLSNTVDEHILAVISMTGVHQTAPVGTPATASGTTSPATVTVGSVGANDLVVDMLYVQNDPTAGADQTERSRENIPPVFGTSSTQPGTAGGVMSWTFTDALWRLGAVAFKPSGGVVNNETGSGKATAQASGIDANIFNETGKGNAPAQASGIDSNVFGETGAAIAPASVRGIDANIFNETGGASATGSAGSADSVVYNETGAGKSPAVASGIDADIFGETGAGSAPAAASGADANIFDETGGVQSPAVASGTRATNQTYTKTGGAESPVSASGTDANIFDETGAAQSPGIVASMDETIYNETGGAQSSISVAGIDSVVYTETGAAESPAVASGIFSPATPAGGGSTTWIPIGIIPGIDYTIEQPSEAPEYRRRKRILKDDEEVAEILALML